MSLRNMALVLALAALAWGFWRSSDFTDIAAGVAIFLFGMMSLERGIHGFAGGTLERLLQAATDRMWKGMAFGIASTAIMQSSTLVALITISFVSAQMIPLVAGIAVVLGTNLGTTTGAWLIAGLGLRVDIAAYAMPLLVFGVVLLFQRGSLARGIGNILLGVGFVFLGIHFIKLGFEAFQHTVDLTAWQAHGLAGLLLYVGIGMLITVIMQSSHATLLVVIAALAAGQVSYDNALALAIGANLGTAVTTALAGFSAHLSGKQLAIVHVAFNLVTALVAVLFIDTLRLVVDAGGDLLGIGADAAALRLALFHTVFNLLGVVLFAPFTRPLAGLLERHVRIGAPQALQPQFLHADALKVPDVAVAAVRNEVLHLYDNAFGVIAHGLSLRRHVIRSGESLTDAVARTPRIMPVDFDEAYEQRIKSIYSAILEFISRTGVAGLPAAAAEELYALREASQNIVLAVKDMKHFHKNLAWLGLSRNSAIRERYDAIRVLLAELLRVIEKLRAGAPDGGSASVLDAELAKLEGFRRDFTLALEAAIRERRIRASEATSLLKDAGYACDMGRMLASAARTLLVATAPRTVETLDAAARDDTARTADA